ncbi:four helix bundle protein [Cloacibacterium sp. Arc13]|jgi:four helix bundle protein|uniref:four helix bundle protein n=1 Tax=Cloacibacterium TaxID=501783 RepID=UPI001BCD5234|nr:four helix bundle protein [Cloacibacterium caeni]
MFLNLNHYNLDVYKAAKELRKQCYKTIRFLPDAEKYNLIDQIRRASTSIVLNISEGSSRKSKIERNRFYEIARGSIIEIDSCCEIILEEKYLEQEDLTVLGKNIKTTFILLSKLMNS